MSNPTRKKQLATDTILFGISTFGSKILVFLLTPLYTAVLMPEEYGMADMISSTVNLIYPVLTLAIAEATLRFTLDKNTSKETVLGNSIAVTAISWVLAAFFLQVFSMIGSELSTQLGKYQWYFLATYGVYTIHLTLANFVKGIGKTKLFAVQGIVQTITVVLCNIYYLLIARKGLEGYLLSIIIGFSAPTMLMFFAGGIWQYLRSFTIDGALLLAMLKYSIPMVPTLLAWAFNANINKYMLIALLPAGEGLGAMGIYSVANKIPSLLTAVFSIFTQAWQLSAISNVNEADESEYYTEVYGILHIVSLIACLLIIPCAKPAARLLFDASYCSAWRHIPFLTLSAFYSCLSGFLASAFRAHKKTGQLLGSVVLGALVNILLNFVLIQTVGIVGAAIATAASFMTTWAVRIYTIQKMISLKIRLADTLISYTLILVSCVMLTFGDAGAYACYFASCAAVTILNRSDLGRLLSCLRQIAVHIKGRSK